MAKTILGIDIGQNQLKLALVNGKTVKKTAVIEMPDKLLQNGRIVSVEAMGELIRDTMRKEHIRCGIAAVVLTGDNVFTSNVTMPLMTEKQLEYNLPFEFRDYISGELKGYMFDYAMFTTEAELKAPAIPAAEGETPVGKSMELLAVALPTEQVEENRAALRKAGLKMVKAAPAVCAFSALLEDAEQDKEYCILDLGYTAIRLYVYRGNRHVVTRVLETGLNSLDQALADAYNVDIHLAHTYLLTNHENCQNNDICNASFNNISVELMRALNFYRFSNPDSNLIGMALCGGGVQISTLHKIIEETLDIPVTILQDNAANEDTGTLAQAVGIARY